MDHGRDPLRDNSLFFVVDWSNGVVLEWRLLLTMIDPTLFPTTPPYTPPPNPFATNAVLAYLP